ncbi:MAG: hypothetical protein H6830_03100 [Planctomycetes bacterium]|nr:hypothetical protein [Planctomycetota bacterium]MCB9911337.1 hypothetical protein [Planctomycetota bacterium]HPF14272.1 hypothetical protein [Planctomycetota bacterium]HRV81837.1 hypothetical protein [Planctomycetota bacterium]
MQRPGSPILPSTPGKRPAFPISGMARERLDQLGHGFLVDVLRDETRKRNDNLGAWTVLSQSLSALGRHQEGLRVDEQLVRLSPEHPVAHYNLACSQALTGRPELALDSLARAIECGFGDLAYLMQDPDLDSLHDHVGFDQLVRRMRQRSQ